MEWSIQDLGALGELISAIVVVVTLVYLARQVRQNKGSTDSATFVSIVHGLNEANDEVMTSSLPHSGHGGSPTPSS